MKGTKKKYFCLENEEILIKRRKNKKKTKANAKQKLKGTEKFSRTLH